MNYTSLVIGIFIAGLVVGIFGLTIGDTVSSYNTTYDSTKLDSFNRINETRLRVEQAKNSINDSQNEDPSFVDKIGRFIGRGLDTASILYGSFETTEAMIEDGVETLPIETPKEMFTYALLGILMALGIAAFVYVMIGRKP
jgi:hypothetical protein